MFYCNRIYTICVHKVSASVSEIWRASYKRSRSCSAKNQIVCAARCPTRPAATQAIWLRSLYKKMTAFYMYLLFSLLFVILITDKRKLISKIVVYKICGIDFGAWSIIMIRAEIPDNWTLYPFYIMFYMLRSRLREVPFFPQATISIIWHRRKQIVENMERLAKSRALARAAREVEINRAS